MIPKKIHHIWLQGSNNIPKEYMIFIHKWKELNPQWKSYVWNESELVSLLYSYLPQYIDIYESLDSLINRINFLKYVLMYVEGGVYADLDMYPLKTFDEFLNIKSIKNIDRNAYISHRYPISSCKYEKRLDDYDIILMSRDGLAFFKDMPTVLLLDNPILFSNSENSFWEKLIDYCIYQRSDVKDLNHEPLGPFGMSEFLYHQYGNNINENNIQIVPSFIMCNEHGESEDTCFMHKAYRGWD
ncbi:MAG: glycosyltransferase family 32 protein [Nanoarchaeota archaeon]